jgi:pimeloyl-ACP methyl ester carboxylesterase
MAGADALRRLLVIWGKHDHSFETTELDAYRPDVPNAEIHVPDASHFALDTAADEIAASVQQFADDARAAPIATARMMDAANIF